jgi:glucoamylase
MEEPQVKTMERCAPGWPGAEPHWTSSAKCGVGTSLQATSRVWFTLGRGILNEIYCPEVDRACVRDMGFLVADGLDFFSDEKCDTRQQVETLAEGVPAWRLTNQCDRYRIEKEIVTDPRLDVVLQRTRFVERDGKDNLHLYLLLAPHLCDGGAENTAWIDNVSGQQILFASRNSQALALACSAPFRHCSAGFVGESDGWQNLRQHKRLTAEYTRAENGNVALIAEIDVAACGGEFVLALGFDSHPLGAAHHARASLLDGFDAACEEYVSAWQKWLDGLHPVRLDGETPRLYKLSAAVLRTHQAKKFPGGSDASLSIPWGEVRGDQDRGGYHLAWPRDLVEIAGGLLALGKTEEAKRVLRFLTVTQKEDGSWPQNMWISGKPNWHGIQMDETALPILFAARAVRDKLIDQHDLKWVRVMVSKALRFIVTHGPATEQDRWENTGGYSPYTLATEIAALVEGADIVQANDSLGANYLRETADSWNDSIERWCYVSGTPLAAKAEVEGHYIRIAPQGDKEPAIESLLSIKGRAGGSELPARDIVSPDALALVRFGLRAPDDIRIRNTLRVIDSLLKIETPFGPCWHRYNGDTYGEHSAGAPFDGSGIGRAWPLLTGERAHFELAAGNRKEAQRLLGAMAAFSSDGGMIPEQIWDNSDIPDRHLFFGKPSGSAMPLAWAHAEYVKLFRSLADGTINDMPQATRQRYLIDKTQSAHSTWRFSDQIESIERGKNLRIELLEPARIHWRTEFSNEDREIETKDSKLGIHFADLLNESFHQAQEIVFSFYRENTGKQKDREFRVQVSGARPRERRRQFAVVKSIYETTR